jgi:transcriptional regulator with XRE-family HTH domain
MVDDPKSRAKRLRQQKFKEPERLLSDDLINSLRRMLADDTDNFPDKIPEYLCDLLQAQHVAILLRQDADLVVRAEYSLKEQHNIFLSKTIVWSVYETGEPFLSTDALSDPRLSGQESVASLALRDVAAVPLVSTNTEIVGVLYAATFGENPSPYFTQENLSVIQAVGNLIGVILSTKAAETPPSGTVITAPEVFRQGIGHYLRTVRISKDLPLRTVAERTEVHYTWLSRVETGKVTDFLSHIDKLTSLARFYEIPVELLLTLAKVKLTDLPVEAPPEEKAWLAEILAEPEVIVLLNDLWKLSPHHRRDALELLKGNLEWWIKKTTS